MQAHPLPILCGDLHALRAAALPSPHMATMRCLQRLKRRHAPISAPPVEDKKPTATATTCA